MNSYENKFSLRLAKLRLQKGASARDMSLSLGQNPGYINNIETGKAYPSMSVFFFICDYLNITPMEFFDTESEQPKELKNLISDLKRIDADSLCHISAIVKTLAAYRHTHS